MNETNRVVTENKIFHYQASQAPYAQVLADWAKTLPRPLVFTNGCFDILHRGHVDYLEKAANLGNGLIVAVNSDASVKALGKQKGRPINPLDDRLAIIASLACTNGVVAFQQSTPLEVIKIIRPDILVKGGDWSLDSIIGAEEVKQWGGQVHSISFEFERSTTALVNKIIANSND